MNTRAELLVAAWMDTLVSSPLWRTTALQRFVVCGRVGCGPKVDKMGSRYQARSTSIHLSSSAPCGKRDADISPVARSPDGFGASMAVGKTYGLQSEFPGGSAQMRIQIIADARAAAA